MRHDVFWKWEFFRHKRPFYFTSELNHAYRKGECSKVMLQFFYKDNYKPIYRFKRRRYL